MFTLDNLGNAVQENDLLCWAAVSAMIARAFPEAGDFRHPTQRDIVIYRRANIKTLANLRAAGVPNTPRHTNFENAKTACQAFGSCNDTNSAGLHLFDIRSTRGKAGHALAPGTFSFELGVRRRPVAIRWEYQGLQPAGGRVRSGEHALLVTGYNPDSHELRVWDPWPAELDNGAAPEGHEKWIPYDTYSDPQSDIGMNAVAHHDSDEYKLRRIGERAPKASEYPPPVPVPMRIPERGGSVDFERGLTGLRETIDAVVRRRVVRDSRGHVVHGPFEAADPFAVVGIGVQALLRTRQAESLLAPRTAAVIVPILRDRRVVDSFLLLRDARGWRPGGYSNNRIASRLVETRTSHASGNLPASGFYLVSVPERAAFFVAHGFRNAARIAPLISRDARDFPRDRAALTALQHRVRQEARAVQSPV